MRALLLDFNGTISDDEHLLCRIFTELFAEEKPLSEDEYYERLAGLADREIVQVWLGRDEPALVERKIERAEQAPDAPPGTQSPGGIPDSYEKHVGAMFDLMALAFQTDAVRVANTPSTAAATTSSASSLPTNDAAKRVSSSACFEKHSAT